MTTPGTGAVETPPVETPWRRLDARMLVVGPAGSLIRLLPAVAVLLITGDRGDIIRLWIALAAAVLVILAGVMRWRTTRYRITAERVELHSGWLRRQRRSVPRDRIRTVDVTAKLLHRMFGLGVVQVSAASGGTQEHAGLSLDAVSKAEAEGLRRELLDRSRPAVATPASATPAASDASGTGVAAGPPPAPAPPPVQVLARLDWSWLRFAPLTFSSLAGVGVIGAAVFNLIDDLGVDPRDIGAVDDAADELSRAPVWLAIIILVALLLVVAVIGALLLFALRWSGYLLTREPAGDDGESTLRVKRGLFTRRSLSVSEQRLRGAEVSEPLLLRAGRGAQTRALTTGLSRDAQGGVLQPPVPVAEAHRVASAALREHPQEITGAPLRAHPRAAMARRMTRALVPTAVFVALAFLLGALVPWLTWLGPTSVVLLPLAAVAGFDRYRNLGHQLTSRYLVSRQGSLLRRTVVLQRAGVIGWTFRQSIFQRRSGLVSLEAVTAAGQGGYTVLDVGAADGVALADAAVPHMLTPFLSTPPRNDLPDGAGGVQGGEGARDLVR